MTKAKRKGRMRVAEIEAQLVGMMLADVEARKENGEKIKKDRHEKRCKEFQDLMQRRFDIDVGTGRDRIKIKGFDLTVSFKSFDLVLVKTCDRCGHTKTSHHIYRPIDLASVLMDENYMKHTCMTEEEKAQLKKREATIEDKVFCLLEEIFDLFHHYYEER